MDRKERTQAINKLQKKHPKTRRQISFHGCNKYSVQFFSKETGELIADYELKNINNFN